ncbi:glycosyltransferase family 2 protein [Marinilabiliaceae bacterium ANBcel2]|nr:glycosyltransferase family 2 protein [Marinilabiliaceae bacterium ANBcel2]
MLSVVIPVYNESPLILTLLDRIKESLKEVPGYEIIFVNDGSSDNTLNILLTERELDKRIKIIDLSRNFGHQAAITAGLENSSGDYIAIMDSDLQDPPELLPKMLDILRSKEFDVVNGFREKRNEGVFRRWLTSIFHSLFSRSSGLQQIENTGHFSMITREVLQAVLEIKEKVRYIPGIRAYVGYKQTTISYSRDERFSGDPKMATTALIKLASDALFAFSRLPLKICLWLGITGVVLFFMAGIYVLISKITGWAPLGWSSTLISIYFLGSIQLTFMGILGEYIYRTYKESQNRPLYFIREKFM